MLHTVAHVHDNRLQRNGVIPERRLGQKFVQLLLFVEQENAQLIPGKTQSLYPLCVFIMSPMNFSFSVYVSSDILILLTS